MTLRVRDLDALAHGGDGDWHAIDELRRALAVAVSALERMEGGCEECYGTGLWRAFGNANAGKCPDCDGTGWNPARRALDTVIGEDV